MLSNAGVELLLAPDLPVVEGDEQHDVADHQADGELADLAVHATSSAVVDAGCGAAGGSAAQRSAGVGSSGSSWRRRAPESLSRMSRASRM